jgi:hypothetical protein
MNDEHWWNDNWQVKTKVIREKLATEPLCPPYIHTDYPEIEPGPLHEDAGTRWHIQQV